MSDYSKGKIYRIWDNGFNKCYIGSTINTLSKRMGGHRAKYKQYKSGNHHYITLFRLFDEYDVSNCKIELLENCPCNSKEELEAREGQHQRDNECINKIIAGRTPEQYRAENEAVIKQRKKQYYDNNKELIAESGKEYRENNKEVLVERKKQYYQNNKGKIAEHGREYRENNKEAIAERRKIRYYETERARQLTKYTCACGVVLNTGGKARYEKRKNHLQYLQTLEETN